VGVIDEAHGIDLAISDAMTVYVLDHTRRSAIYRRGVGDSIFAHLVELFDPGIDQLPGCYAVELSQSVGNGAADRAEGLVRVAMRAAVRLTDDLIDHAHLDEVGGRQLECLRGVLFEIP